MFAGYVNYVLLVVQTIFDINFIFGLLLLCAVIIYSQGGMGD